MWRSNMELYLGDPNLNREDYLAPDNRDAPVVKKYKDRYSATYTWDLTQYKPKTAIYMACTYANTSVAITRPLSSEKKCTITFEAFNPQGARGRGPVISAECN